MTDLGQEWAGLLDPIALNRSRWSPRDWATSWGPAPRWGTPRTPSRATFGPVVAEISSRMGRPFYPWQRYVVDVGLEVLDDGSWAYDEVIVEVESGRGSRF